jgi:hypothetical protein
MRLTRGEHYTSVPTSTTETVRPPCRAASGCAENATGEVAADAASAVAAPPSTSRVLGTDG